MSSKAREVHFKYRIFSAFLFIKNDISLDEMDEFTWEELYDFDEQTIGLYSSLILSEDAKEKRSNVLQYLTWLEHRRWNAYMRSIGFSYDIKKDKNIELKLHGCLCECSRFPLCGYNNIRLDDLKKRLFNYSFNDEQVSKEGFEICIKKWMRLPKKVEQVQIELLLEKLDKNLIQSITKLKNSKNAECTLKNLLDRIVDSCLCEDNNESHIPIVYDMLDFASIRNGLDMKYYDFPQETDTNLIESYRAIIKEAH